MSTLRLAKVPSDHVVAELASFALASESAFNDPLVQLNPDLGGATGRLWRRAETEILGAIPGFSVDEAVALRDLIWFDDTAADAGEPTRQPLHAYLRRLARTYLARRGSFAVPRPSPFDPVSADAPLPRSTARGRVAWRWLTFALPSDLLLAALGSPDSMPTRVGLVSPRLASHLRDRGFAETHLHGAAGLDFSTLWIGLMLEIAEQKARQEDAFESPGAVFGEGEALGAWLLRAAIGRLACAAYLTRRRPGETLDAFCDHWFHRLPPTGRWLLDTCLRELRSGRLAVDPSRLAPMQALYKEMSSVSARRQALRGWETSGARFDTGAILEADPMADYFAAAGLSDPAPEMRFCAAALDQLERGDATEIADLFWQVVRVRCLFYRHVVQRPMIPGLQWFLRHYDRMRLARTAWKPFRVPIAASLCGLGEGLDSLELRTAPDSALGDMLRLIDQWSGSATALVDEGPRGRSMELGIVFHFARLRGKDVSKGRPRAFEVHTHADPGTDGRERPINPTGYRHAAYYNDQRRRAQALGTLIQRFPATLYVVRGLDACTDEQAIPTWVLAPLFRYLRDSADAASASLGGLTGKRVPSLRMTVHAGEDFTHLLTGLRNTHQAIRYFGLGEGDRIGHALALGVDPLDWSSATGRVPVRREQRLFDLVWEWSWYGHEALHPGPGRKLFLEREIARLSELLFDRSIEPYVLERFVEALHDEAMLHAVGFPNGLFARSWERAEADGADLVPHLVYRYLTDRRIFLRGARVDWVDASTEGEVLAEIQNVLRRRLCEMCIAVEVNPSSNLLIGDFSELAKHPLWRLHPPRPDPETPPISVCIGSDDPLTFATSLPEEYQFLYDSLILSGLSDEESLSWLDKARQSGLEHRFTLPAASLADLMAPRASFASAPESHPEGRSRSRSSDSLLRLLKVPSDRAVDAPP